jgi:hypothetical protein
MQVSLRHLSIKPQHLQQWRMTRGPRKNGVTLGMPILLLHRRPPGNQPAQEILIIRHTTRNHILTLPMQLKVKSADNL